MQCRLPQNAEIYRVFLNATLLFLNNHARGQSILIKFGTCYNYFNISSNSVKGYWHQRADERHGKPPQGKQELLVAKDKVGRLPDEFEVSMSIGCDTFPSVL